MDVIKGAGRRSVSENGTPIQRVLHNALQAAALLCENESFDQENTWLNNNNNNSSNNSVYRPTLSSPLITSSKRSLFPDAQHHSDDHRQTMSKMSHKNKLVLNEISSNNNNNNNNIEAHTNVSSSFTALPAAVLDDPCAEAFLNVIGPRACQILIQ